jgi:hypothetical protein
MEEVYNIYNHVFCLRRDFATEESIITGDLGDLHIDGFVVFHPGETEQPDETMQMLANKLSDEGDPDYFTSDIAKGKAHGVAMMSMRRRMNPEIAGIFNLKCKCELSIDEVHDYINTLSNTELKKFYKNAKVM